MGRQPCCDKIGLKKGPWTAEEDRKLVDFLLNNGHCCWRTVPKLAGLLRCGKSCRLRWTNYLRPDLKRGVLSDMEEKLIIELHSHLGNRWAKIAAHLPGRTDNEIKNYWNTHIKKKLRRMGFDPMTHQPIADTTVQLAVENAQAKKPEEVLVQFPAIVKSEEMSTSASEAFEDDKIPSRFGMDSVTMFPQDVKGSNPVQPFGSFESEMLLQRNTPEETPLMLQSEDGLWELGDFGDSNLSVSMEPPAALGTGSSSCNAAVLDVPDLKWVNNDHEEAAHTDMLVAGSILDPYETNAHLWAQGMDAFSTWDETGVSSGQVSSLRLAVAPDFV